MNASSTTSSPEVSIVIPVYNEEKIIESSLRELCGRLEQHGIDHEIVLAENGSRDHTVQVVQALSTELPRVTIFSHAEPNYGGALREGIRRARGRFVICEEIDLCDVDFHMRALELLRAGDAQMVVGSKAMKGAHDERPLFRRTATRVYNGLLRVTLGFRGTDTHGLKAFVRERVAPIAARCVIERDVFASELVIRAQREGVNVVEIPVDVHEKRAPSVGLVRRVPKVVTNLAALMVSIHLRGEGRDTEDA